MSVGFSWFIWAPTVRPDDRQSLATSLATPELTPAMVFGRLPPACRHDEHRQVGNPPYYQAKALALAALAVVGDRPARSI
jgi:hypothetical protein